MPFYPSASQFAGLNWIFVVFAVLINCIQVTALHSLLSAEQIGPDQRLCWHFLQWGTGTTRRQTSPFLSAVNTDHLCPAGPSVNQSCQLKWWCAQSENKPNLSSRQPADISTWMQKQCQVFAVFKIYFLQKKYDQNSHQRTIFPVSILSVVHTFSPKKRRGRSKRNYLFERKRIQFNFSEKAQILHHSGGQMITACNPNSKKWSADGNI